MPSLFTDVPDYVWKLLKTTLIVVICYLALRISKYLIKKFTRNKKSLLPKKKSDTIESILLSATKLIIYFIAIQALLSLFNLGSGLATVIFSGITVAIGFASQNFMKDILMGISVLFFDSFNVGDIIAIGAYVGKVESLGIQSTTIRATNGDLFVIPNSEIRVITKIHIDEKNEHEYQFTYFKSTENNSSPTVDENVK